MVVPLIIFLLVIGVILFLLGPRIHPTIKTIVLVLLIIVVALWILDAFGIYPMPSAFKIGGGK